MSFIFAINRRGWIISAVLNAATLSVLAQSNVTYPTKPVKIVVGYAAGGATDVLARVLAAQLSEQTGQTFIIDNRSGANSNVGAQMVARAPADGYILYVFTIANAINPSLYKNLGLDAQKDFIPISLVAKFPNVLVVNPQLPIHNIADYIKFAKANPSGITFASSGPGSSIHLSGEIFKQATNANMLHVPYRGSAPAVTDLMGGQVQSMFDNISSSLPQIQSGHLRAIAVTSAERSSLLPNVPTIAESGITNFNVQSWSGLAAPAGTPKFVIDRLNSEINKALVKGDVRKRLADLGATTAADSPDEFRKFIDDETQRWKKVVTISGTKLD